MQMERHETMDSETIMNDINQLFFELIQVAIGTHICLSHTPSADEWGELYAMTKKQSLIGVCFAGIQMLTINHPSSIINLSEILRLQWMGMAAKIQQRNEVVNRQCVDLQKRLSDDGFQSCILKGQGVALYYPEHLKGLRQSGDIDVWMWCEGNLKERRAKIIEYACKRKSEAKAFIHHVDCKVFDDTETEFHYLPSWFNSPISHNRFVRWCETQIEEQMNHEVGEFTMPNAYFNSIFLLSHIYRHLFQEGIGLRQLMDYYFVIGSKDALLIDKKSWQHTIKSLGMSRIAGAVMWVMDDMYALPKEQQLCEPDENEGRFLLNEIMLAGNFGKYDERINRSVQSEVYSGLLRIQRNTHFLMHYPCEVIWNPIWKIWHWMWIKMIRYN